MFYNITNYHIEEINKERNEDVDLISACKIIITHKRKYNKELINLKI